MRIFRAVAISIVTFGLAVVIMGSASSQEVRYLEPLDTVFEMGEPGDPVEFFRVSSIEVDSQGTLWVLDSGSSTVHGIGLDGSVVSFGRAGFGPGEFQMAMAIRVDSLVRVYDGLQQRVSVFEKTGEHVLTSRIRQPENLLAMVSIGLPGDQSILVRAGRYAPEHPGHDPRRILMWWGAASGVADTLLARHTGSVGWLATRNTYGVVAAPFGPGGAWALAGDSVLVLADGYENTVKWLRISSRGEPPSTIAIRTLPDTSRVISGDDRNRFIEATLRDNADLRRRSRLRWFLPDRWSAASAVVLDAELRVWVRHALEPMERWSRISHRSTDIESLVLPPGFTLKAVDGDLLIGVSSSDLGVQTIQVLRRR